MTDISTDNLAKLGAATLAALTLTFERDTATMIDIIERAAETFTGITASAPDARAETRAACARVGVITGEYGDNAPDVQFTGHLNPAQTGPVRAQMQALHDAREGDGSFAEADDIINAANDYISALEAYAGIRVK